MTTSVVVGALTVLTFAPVNAPTKELVYRGYLQAGLARGTGSRWLAVSIPSVDFGPQHVFFGTDVPRGVRLRRRLLRVGSGLGPDRAVAASLVPIIVSHFIVDLLTSLPALLMPLLVARPS